MKLFVDDIRNPPSDKWHICRTALSAVRAIDQFYNVIDEVSLDHDISHQVALGGMSRPYPCEETFETVARHMAAIRIGGSAEHGDFDWQPVITIHTSNPAGADYMQTILARAGFKNIHTDLKPAANRLETML